MTDVVVVGGGPVGLYLAALLLQEGVRVKVLEQRLCKDAHTRAIGVHPPALAALDRVDVASGMVSEGVRIRRGIAISAGNIVGSMSFSPVSDRFPFVLALPQYRTEALLEERLLALDGTALVRGARVSGIKHDGARVTLDVERSGTKGSGVAGGTVTAGLLVVADGARSRMRGLLGIPARTRTYPDHYVMGDFADSGVYGQDAVLFLEASGIVESFPLPGDVRRWVVRVSRHLPCPGASELAHLVNSRTRILPDAKTNTMLSSFNVRSSIARTFLAERAVLVGDAAHEISPIGGQGMNVGWLDAEELAPIIREFLDGKSVGQRLQEFNRSRQRAARVARWQSEVNMLLGRPLRQPLLSLRNRAIETISAVGPMNRLVARRFTMQ